MSYLDVVLHGSDEEKYEQCFLLLDLSSNGMVEYKDMKRIAIGITKMWSAALGKPVEMHEEIIKDSFNHFSGDKSHFTLEE